VSVLKKWIFILLLTPALVVAEISPGNHPYDSRVKLVDYNALDVVKVTTYYGVSTYVQFDSSETIKEIAVGDEPAWNLVPRGNRFYIKPKQKKADTNVTVVTDKRTYHFSLYVAKRSIQDASAWLDPNLTYGLIFKYPEEEAKKMLAEAKLAQAQALEAKIKAQKKARQDVLRKRLIDGTKLDRGESSPSNQLLTSTPEKDEYRRSQYPTETPDEDMDNFDYWVAGSELISPTGARDDGRFTYLLFSNNRDMPAVYLVDEAGKESLIGTHVEGNTIVVHLVVPKLVLRRGDAVACLLNKGFDLGSYNDRSGTVSSDVTRTIKEAE
jgi:type IV secretion system protein VirB9